MAEEEIPEEEPQIEEPQERVPMRERPSEPLVSKEVRDVIDLKKFMEEGKEEKGEKQQLSLIEMIMLQDWMDRREDRREKKNPSMAAEDITKIVKDLLPKEEKMPEWAKQLQSKQEEIANRILADEQEKERQKIIKEATEPLKAELEKERETRGRLEERVKDIEGKPPSTGEGTNPIKFFVDTRKMLEEAGMLPKEGTIILGEGGIPVKGEIPAWAAFGPIVAEKILASVEKRMDSIAAKIGLVSQTPEGASAPETKELIRLPPKPEIPPPKPAEEPKEEAKPEEPLIKIPEKPKPEETKPPTPPEPELTEETLSNMKMAEIWKIAAELKIPRKGKKAELIKKILEAKQGGTEQNPETHN